MISPHLVATPTCHGNHSPECSLRSRLLVRHKLLKIDTGIEIPPSHMFSRSVQTSCRAAKIGTRGWTHSSADTGYRTPQRTPRRPSKHFMSPGRIFYPSPGSVRHTPNTFATTPRRQVGSFDSAAASEVLPPLAPPSPLKDTIEQPRQRRSRTEDKDERSEGTLNSQSLLANANVRSVIATYALYLVRCIGHF